MFTSITGAYWGAQNHVFTADIPSHSSPETLHLHLVIEPANHFFIWHSQYNTRLYLSINLLTINCYLYLIAHLTWLFQY